MFGFFFLLLSARSTFDYYQLRYIINCNIILISEPFFLFFSANVTPPDISDNERTHFFKKTEIIK